MNRRFLTTVALAGLMIGPAADAKNSVEAHIHSEFRKWGGLVRDAGIKGD